MRGPIRHAVLAALGLATLVLVPATPLQGAPVQDAVPFPSSHWLSDIEPAPVFTYRDGQMALLVQELERSSPTVARMLRTLRGAGMPVIFGTVDGVLDDVRTEHRHYDPVRQRALGFMAPLMTATAERGPAVTSTIVIALNLVRLEELFLIARSIPRPPDVTWAEIQRLETLSLLGHEIIHAYGLVLASGDPRYGCRDPEHGQAPELSCVVVGENVVRREIGAPLDWGYGMSALVDLPERYAELGRHRLALRSIGEVTRTIIRSRSSVTQPETPTL